MARITLNNVGNSMPGNHGSGERAEDSGGYRKLAGPKKPAAPIVGNTAVKQGPHSNSKSGDAGKQKNAGITSNGSMKAKPTPAGGTTRTEAPLGRAAKKLYPSAK